MIGAWPGLSNTALALIALAFVAGAIPFGVILAKARGIDLKKIGSGNIGATNAARALGKKAGIIVLVLDTAKAFFPTAAALWLHLGPEIAAATGFAAFCGHIFSPFLKLKGGKGVACGLGTFLALAPIAAAIAVAVTIATVAATRLGSLGSLLGAAALLPALWLLRAPQPYLVLGGAMFLLIVWRHRENIARMVQGNENKL